MMKTYTIKEITGILKMDPSNIRRYLREGKIKGVKIGKKWLITEEELKRVLSEGVREPKKEVER